MRPVTHPRTTFAYSPARPDPTLTRHRLRCGEAKANLASQTAAHSMSRTVFLNNTAGNHDADELSETIEQRVFSFEQTLDPEETLRIVQDVLSGATVDGELMVRLAGTLSSVGPEILDVDFAMALRNVLMSRLREAGFVNCLCSVLDRFHCPLTEPQERAMGCLLAEAGVDTEVLQIIDSLIVSSSGAGDEAQKARLQGAICDYMWRHRDSLIHDDMDQAQVTPTLRIMCQLRLPEPLAMIGPVLSLFLDYSHQEKWSPATMCAWYICQTIEASNIYDEQLLELVGYILQRAAGSHKRTGVLRSIPVTLVCGVLEEFLQKQDIDTEARQAFIDEHWGFLQQACVAVKPENRIVILEALAGPCYVEDLECSFRQTFTAFLQHTVLRSLDRFQVIPALGILAAALQNGHNLLDSTLETLNGLEITTDNATEVGALLVEIYFTGVEMAPLEPCVGNLETFVAGFPEDRFKYCRHCLEQLHQ